MFKATGMRLEADLMPFFIRPLGRALLTAAVLAMPAAAAGAAPAMKPPTDRLPTDRLPTGESRPADGHTAIPGTHIVAVVNSDVVSSADVSNRAKLFALSTGLPMAPDVLDRLKPQITRQLVDERLRMQEILRRKIVVRDQQIAGAIRDIEARNNMPAGALRQKLAADGVSQRTLIDQIRAQLGWTQVLREQLGEKLAVTDADVEAQQRIEAQQIGKPEYRVGEIFVPVDDPANTADAQKFTETVIQELRAGAPFSVVAAQFSQSQTALAGGELGWVQPNQLDPEVARLVTEMPVGAISNPVKVPGGFSVATLQGKREVGRDIGTLVTLRQVFLPFTSPLNPQAPTEQQKHTLEKARGISASVHGCDQMEQLAKANNSTHPADPGEVRLEGVNPPAFRQLLASMPIGSATQPLVASDGIAVAVLCSREQKNLASNSPEDIKRKLVNERVELLSRQLLRDLRRQATIEIRTGGV
jgi:peptidyl-prolyl cis-trans isomerase SurA